jgi:hypothetical protein
MWDTNLAHKNKNRVENWPATEAQWHRNIQRSRVRVQSKGAEMEKGGSDKHTSLLHYGKKVLQCMPLPGMRVTQTIFPQGDSNETTLKRAFYPYQNLSK